MVLPPKPLKATPPLTEPRRPYLPDGRLTVYDLIRQIPDAQRQALDEDIAALFDQGYGWIRFYVKDGKLDRWETVLSRKVK